MGIRTGFSEFGDFVLANDWALIVIVTLAAMVAIQYAGEWALSLARKLKYSISTLLALVIAFIIIALTVRFFNWITHSNSDAVVLLSSKSDQTSASQMHRVDSLDSLQKPVELGHTVRNGVDRKRSQRKEEEERQRRKRSARPEKENRPYKHGKKNKKARDDNHRRGNARHQQNIPKSGKRRQTSSQESVKKDQRRGATSKRSPTPSASTSAHAPNQQRVEHQRSDPRPNPPGRASSPSPPPPPLSTAIAAYVPTGPRISGTIKSILGLAVEGFDSVVDLAKSVVKKRDSVSSPAVSSSTHDGKRSRG